jgi:hypothetical protein
LSGEDIITRRTLLGAVKCALRCFRRELVTDGLYFILRCTKEQPTARF